MDRSDVGASPYWNITANSTKSAGAGSGNKGELDASCEGISVRWPTTLGSGSMPTLSAPLQAVAWDDEDNWETYLGTDTPNIFPFLTLVKMADLKDGGEAGSCLIHLTDHDSDNLYRSGWHLQAQSFQDARAWCQARVLDLGSSGAVKAACPAFDPETYFTRYDGAEVGDCVDSGRFRAHARDEHCFPCTDDGPARRRAPR